MKLVAGVDIGNATTEVALAKIQDNEIQFLSSGIVPTTGIKGTINNVHGVFQSLKDSLDEAGFVMEDLDTIRVNEAAPVIGDVAMETITETIITESTMIGHNPTTPGGLGIAKGESISIEQLGHVHDDKEYIVVIPESVNYSMAAQIINENSKKITITGAIIKNDDGVLINNRLNKKIPIVDEVSMIEKVPLGMMTAIEVASPGNVVEVLSNPYGIASMFELSSDETKQVVPIARALIGNRSAVVIKTPEGDVKERRIPAGKIDIMGCNKSVCVNVDEGAEKIMDGVRKIIDVEDIKGEPGTNAGGMLEKVRQVMANLTGQHPRDIKIQDLLAVDTFVPQKVSGGIANEFSLESAVGIAAMVKADNLQMESIGN